MSGSDGVVAAPLEKKNGSIEESGAMTAQLESTTEPLPSAATRPIRPKHVLTIDLEDYFQVEAFSRQVDRSDWQQYPARVVGNTHRLLDLFDQYHVKATFFVLGWVAKHFPTLVREVHERGHELACHSYWHRKIYTLAPAEFREDTRLARMAIEDAASVSVSGYRAPTWSVTKDSLWALDILLEEGFSYDSSIFPVHHDLYGIPGASRYPWVYTSAAGHKLLELPPATIEICGTNLAAAGGGYFRLLPMRFTEWAFQRFEKEKKSLVFYLHPWEIDPQQPRIAASMKSRLRHYTNLAVTQQRLEKLLQRYSFQPFRDYIRDMESNCSTGD
jgi:polysaccharide deacetylase family protein (PEP-CTERM system associated)